MRATEVSPPSGRHPGSHGLNSQNSQATLDLSSEDFLVKLEELRHSLREELLRAKEELQAWFRTELEGVTEELATLRLSSSLRLLGGVEAGTGGAVDGGPSVAGPPGERDFAHAVDVHSLQRRVVALEAQVPSVNSTPASRYRPGGSASVPLAGGTPGFVSSYQSFVVGPLNEKLEKFTSLELSMQQFGSQLAEVRDVASQASALAAEALASTQGQEAVRQVNQVAPPPLDIGPSLTRRVFFSEMGGSCSSPAASPGQRTVDRLPSSTGAAAPERPSGYGSLPTSYGNPPLCKATADASPLSAVCSSSGARTPPLVAVPRFRSAPEGSSLGLEVPALQTTVLPARALQSTLVPVPAPRSPLPGWSSPGPPPPSLQAARPAGPAPRTPLLGTASPAPPRREMSPPMGFLSSRATLGHPPSPCSTYVPMAGRRVHSPRPFSADGWRSVTFGTGAR